MVSLVRWEPIVAEAFPSIISFWIFVNGIPTIYHGYDALWAVTQELGEVVEVDVELSCITVALDGLKPLVFQVVVPFDTGDEAVVSLVYDKLNNYCDHCQVLLHLKDHCPNLRSSLVVATAKEPVMDSYWETQRRKSVKRGSRVLEKESVGGSMSRNTSGQGSGLNLGGQSSKENTAHRRVEHMDVGKSAKLKEKHIEFAYPTRYNPRGLCGQGMSKQRYGNWPKSLYPGKKEGALGTHPKDHMASESVGVPARESLSGVSTRGGSSGIPPATEGGYQMTEAELLSEEGELVDIDKLESGLRFLRNVYKEQVQKPKWAHQKVRVSGTKRMDSLVTKGQPKRGMVVLPKPPGKK